MLKKIKELSVVLLKDGRKATVQIVHCKDGEEIAYLVEIEDETHDLPTVTIDQIERILWEPNM